MLWTLTFNIYVVCFLWRGWKTVGCLVSKQPEMIFSFVPPLRRHNWQPSPGCALPSEGRLQISSRGHGRTPVWSRRSHRRCWVWGSRGTGGTSSYESSRNRSWQLTCCRRKVGWWGSGPRQARRDFSRQTSPDPSNPQHPVTLSPATPLRVAPNPSPSLKPHDRRISDVMEVKLKDPDPFTHFEANQPDRRKVKVLWTKFASSTIQTEKNHEM